MAHFGIDKFGEGHFGDNDNESTVLVRTDQRIPAIYSVTGSGATWSDPAGLATGIDVSSVTIPSGGGASKNIVARMDYQRFINTDSATIKGVLVEITLTSNQTGLIPTITAPFGTPQTLSALSATGQQVITLGSLTTNPFGGSPTAADYNSPDFGITFALTNPGGSNASVSVEHIAIWLAYEEADMSFVHEPEVAFGKMQIGAETTWGTVATVDTALGSVNGKATPKMQEVVFTPQGVVAPTVQAIVRQWTELAFDGKVTFEEIGEFLRPLVSGGQSDPYSNTVECGGLKFAGAVITSVGISVAKEGDWTVKGSMKGKKHECETAGTPLIAAVTAGLTIPDLTPVLGPGTTLKYGASTASTQVSKWWECNINIPALWDLVFYQGDVTARTVKQLQAVPTFDFSIEADATGLAMILPNTTYVWELKQVTGAKSITITWQGRLSEPGELSNMDGLYGYSYKGTIMHQATAIGVTIV
jgi:hypothetical protein